jgi:hypothetical protein
MAVVRSMMAAACSRLASRASRWWHSRGTPEAKVEEGAAGEVDDDGLEVEYGGGVLRVGDEAVACSEVRDKVVSCSGARIDDGSRWHGR